MVHVLAALRLDGRVPADGEARLVAAVLAVTDGRTGAVPLAFPEALVAWQFAAVTALLPAPPPGVPVSDAVRAAGLALGAVTVLLVWGVLRRLGCGGVSTAVGIGVVGVLPAAVDLHAAATPAAVAVPWLLVAVLLSWRGRVLGVLAVVAAAVAVLTVPLVGAMVLALAAHAVADRLLAAPPWLPRRALSGGLAVAAVAVAASASGSGPLAGRAAPVVPTSVALVGFACGLVVLAAGWRVRWVRPLLGAVLLVLLAGLVAGPGRAAAALTALPLLAVVAAAVTDDVAARAPALGWSGSAVTRAVATSAAVVGALAAVAAPRLLASDAPATAPAAALPDPAATALLAWASDPATSGAALHADAADRAELVAAGFPPDRLREPGGPAADGDLVLRTRRPAVAPDACAPGTLVATLPRPTGPADICTARSVVDTDPQARPSRVRVGTALAGNPGVRLAPAAADLLRQGAVDPRVMIVLATLAGGHTLDVADFPPSTLEPPTAVRRQVLVTAMDGVALTAGDASSGVGLREWLRNQHAPYTPTVLRDDPAGLVVGYPSPTPTGLLPS